MFELGLILAFLVPAGLILGIVVLNRSRGGIQRGGAVDDGLSSTSSTSGVTWIGTDATTWANSSNSNWSSGDSSGSWESGNSSCESGGFSDSGGSSDSGSSGDSGGGGGSCD